MRKLLSKTWVKVGLVLMALPTSVADASPSGNGSDDTLAWSFLGGFFWDALSPR